MSFRLSERVRRAVYGVAAHPAAGLAALLFVSFAWGAGYVGTGTAIRDGFGPLWFQSTRLFAAASLLGGVAWYQGYRFPRLRSAALSGVLAWAIASGSQTLAQQSITPGTAALVMGTGPLVAVGMDSLLRRARPLGHELAGLAMGLVGLVLLIGGSPQLDPAVFLLLLACVAWSSSSVIEARRNDGSHPLAVASLQMFAGASGLALVALLSGEALPHPGLRGALGWGWLGFVCAGIGMPLWLWVLRVLPMSTVMLQASLSPLAAALLGAVLMGERWNAAGLVGMVLIALSAAITVAWPKLWAQWQRRLLSGRTASPLAPPRSRWRRVRQG